MINRNESRLIAQERRNLASQRGRKMPQPRKSKPPVLPMQAKV